MRSVSPDGAGNQSRFRRYIKKFEVAQPVSGTYANDQYTNPDLVPMDKTRRTWGWQAYVTYWMTSGFAIYNYSTGSALIGFGLSGTQAIGASVFSPVLLAFLCVFCGWIGCTHHITYTAASRMAWGMRGTYFAVAIRVMPGLIWDGIEAFWGGQAISTCIGTWSLTWANWHYPLANGSLELKDLIGFFLYYIVFLVTMWFPPEKLYRPFLVSCVGFAITVFGLLIWSVHNAGGAGYYFSKDYKPEVSLGNSVPWAVVYGATAVLGNMAVITLGQADWCRFSATGARAPMLAQFIACPIFTFIICVLGIIITSAASNVLGAAYWQPYLLLREIQAHYNNSASSRAAVFFASITCAFAQVCVNIILNSVASAMDLTSYAPKWLNIRRGAYLIAAIGLAVNPWQITTTAATFITVLNGFGCFYGPCSGILVADYWIVRKKLVKMDDLYRGNADSIYWYYKGFNWRAFVAFFVSIAPAMPGYIMGARDINGGLNGWIKLSRLGFLTGFCISVLVYWLVNMVFPPPGLGQGTDHHDEDTLVLPSGYRQDKPTQGQYSMIIDGMDISNSHFETEKGAEAKANAV